MNKLTRLAGLPKPQAAPPHSFRVLGSTVLATNGAGEFVFFSEEEYRRFLREGGPELAPSAEREVKTSLLAWTGPSAHVVHLERKKSVMSLELVKETVDLIFSAPGPRLSLVLAGRAPWSRVWLAVEYARRRAEWTGRAVSLARRVSGGEDFKCLEKNEVAILREDVIDGAPQALGRADGQSFLVGPAARDAAGWMSRVEKSGASRVLLSPAEETGLDAFLSFYAEALDRLLEGPVREERAAAFLAAGRWHIPGQDVLAELAYGPGGEVYSSEEGLRLAEEGITAFRLGSTGDCRFSDLGRREAVRALIAAAHGDNQPLCQQCAYKPFCSLPPSVNFRRQGTIWGQTPSSRQCALHMGILDLIFERLKIEKYRKKLQKWSLDMDSQRG